MKSSGTERRRNPRAKHPPRHDLKLYLDDGGPKPVEIRLLDVGPDTVGVESPTPLAVGSTVSIRGEIISGGAHEKLKGSAQVRWCVAGQNTAYRAGLSFADAGMRNFFGRALPGIVLGEAPALDYYEVLEVSHTASPDTIHRVYRILAQRHHPDNADTGDEEEFKRLLEAYRVLSDAEQRASYDVRQCANHHLRWKIFDQPQATHGFEAEKRKRHGILSLLYAKRLNQSDQPTLTIRELEELLGCPREHLEFSLWFLKECAWVTRSDSGRFSITAKGVEHAESGPAWTARQGLLLPAVQ